MCKSTLTWLSPRLAIYNVSFIASMTVAVVPSFQTGLLQYMTTVSLNKVASKCFISELNCMWFCYGNKDRYFTNKSWIKISVKFMVVFHNCIDCISKNRHIVEENCSIMTYVNNYFGCQQLILLYLNFFLLWYYQYSLSP